MKIMNKCIILLSFLAILASTKQVNAQNEMVDFDISAVLKALNTGTDNFEELNRRLEEVKARARKEFGEEQAIIDKEQARIDRNAQELAKDNHREAQMLYAEWKQRAEALSKLEVDKELLHERQLALKMRQVIFKDLIVQVEQKLLASLAKQVEKEMELSNLRLGNLIDAVENTEF